MRHIGIIVVLLVALAGCRARFDPAADHAAIRALADRMGVSLCADDWETYQTTWANDSTVEHLDASVGSWITGWAELSSFYKGLLPQIKGCRVEYKPFPVHVSKDGSMAWAAIEGVLHPADSTALPTTLWGAFAFEKRNGRWVMVLDHSGVIPVRDSAAGH